MGFYCLASPESPRSTIVKSLLLSVTNYLSLVKGDLEWKSAVFVAVVSEWEMTVIGKGLTRNSSLTNVSNELRQQGYHRGLQTFRSWSP